MDDEIYYHLVKMYKRWLFIARLTLGFMFGYGLGVLIIVSLNQAYTLFVSISVLLLLSLMAFLVYSMYVSDKNRKQALQIIHNQISEVDFYGD